MTTPLRLTPERLAEIRDSARCDLVTQDEANDLLKELDAVTRERDETSRELWFQFGIRDRATKRMFARREALVDKQRSPDEEAELQHIRFRISELPTKRNREEQEAMDFIFRSAKLLRGLPLVSDAMLAKALRAWNEWPDDMQLLPHWQSDSLAVALRRALTAVVASEQTR